MSLTTDEDFSMNSYRNAETTGDQTLIVERASTKTRIHLRDIIFLSLDQMSSPRDGSTNDRVCSRLTESKINF